MIVNDHITRLLATERVAELQRPGAFAGARRSVRSTRARQLARRASDRQAGPARASRADAGSSRNAANTVELRSRAPRVRESDEDARRSLDRGVERRPPAGRPSDADLIRLVESAAAGDDGAWGVLVQRFDRTLRRIARTYRLSDADAGDVAQATWLKLFEHFDELKEPSRVGGWLATTARRECVRILDRSRQLDLLPPDLVPDRESLDVRPADLLVTRERDEAIRSGFVRLRGRDQALLGLLTAGTRPDYRAIAAALGMPIGSIGPTRARALERLRAELESEGTLTWIAA